MANEFVVKNGLITPTVQLPGATSGSITISAPPVAGTTTIALPATAGTIVTTGDTGTVTNAMLAGSIANNKLVNSTISGTALGSTLPTLTLSVSGTGLAGSATYNATGAATFTVTSNATSANTASTIVSRDASGNFSAGTITAALVGNASTATTLQTARTISLTGDVTGSVSFDGSGNAAISTTIQPDSVALGTDTTGNYMVNVTAGTGVSVSHTQGEGSTATVSIGQAVGTTDNVTFNNVAVNGTLTSDDITSANISVTGNATITGNLTVSGTTTTVNSTTVALADLNLELARNAANAAQANGAGITVTGPTTAATFTYTSADDRWNLNKNLNVTTVFGALSGNASTASTWQTARTLSFTGDATGSMSVDGSTNASAALTLANSGVSAATYNNVTVNAKGLVTSGSNVAYLTAESDTLATVTGRGATTSTLIRINNQLQVGQNTNGTAWIDAYGGFAYYGADSDSTGMKINSAGNATFYADARAPIFYDSNNTAFYVDPNNTSRLAELRVGGGPGGSTAGNLYIQGNNNWRWIAGFAPDYGVGNGFGLYSDSLGYYLMSLSTSGNWYFGENNHNSSYRVSINGTGYASGDFRAPIFYDSNDTAYYVDPASTSVINILDARNTAKISYAGYAGIEYYNTAGGQWQAYVGTESNSGNLRFNSYNGNHNWYSNSSSIATLNSTRLRLGSPNGSPASAIVSTFNRYLEIAVNDANSTGYTYASGVVFHHGGVSTSALSYVQPDANNGYFNFSTDDSGYQGVFTSSSMRAPIFYDSSDTGYYADPNSVSNMWALKLNRTTDHQLQVARIRGLNTDLTGDYIHMYERVHIGYPSGWGGIDAPSYGLSTWGQIHWSRSAGTSSWGYGVLSMDSGWGGGGHPTIGSGGSSGSLIMLHNVHLPFRTDNPRTGASGRAGIRLAVDAAATNWWDVGLTGDAFEIYRSSSGTQQLWINSDGDVSARASSRAPIFYDRDNTGYYADPASTSNLNALTTNAQTILGGQIYVSGTNANTLNSGWGAVGEADIWINYRGYNDGWSYFRNFNIGNGKGTAIFWASGTTGNIGIGTDQTAGARLHVRRGTPSGVQAINSNATVLLDNTGDNFIQFRNSADNGTYSGLLMSDNNQGGYVVFGNAGAGDLLRLGGYSNISFDVGTEDSTSSVAIKTQRGYIDSSANLFAFGSMRSPIFYDYNDTAYYVDPNSASNLNTRLSIQSYADSSPNYTYGIQMGGGYAGIAAWNFNPNGSSIYRNLTFYSTGWNGSAVVTRDVLTIGNYGAYVGIRENNPNNYLQIGSVGGSGYSANHIAIGDGTYAYAEYLNGSSYMAYYTTSGYFYFANQYLRAEGSMRAPIFYDSDDTSYYLDPANSLLSLKVAGNIDLYARSSSWAEGIRIHVPTSANWGGIRWTRDRANDDGNWALGFTGIDSTDDLTFWGNVSGTGAMKARMDLSANFTVYGSVRSPIFYDSNDTNWYLDPASTSNLNYLVVRGLRFYGEGGDSGNGSVYSSYGIYQQGGSWTHPYPDLAIGFHTGIKIGAYYGYNGTRFYNNSDWATQIFSVGDGDNGVRAYYDMRSPIFYDQDNTGYYTDPNSTSNLVGLTVANTITGNISGNAGNTSSIGNATGGSYTWTGAQYFRSNLGSTSGSLSYPPLQAYAEGGNSAFMSFHRSGSFAVNFGLDSDNILRIGGWSASANRWELNMGGDNTVAGSFRAPIFYDSNDTNYFIDPASTSDSALRMRGGALFGPNTSWGAYLYVGGNGRVGTSASVAVTNGNLHLDSQNGYALYLNWYSTNNIYTQANLGIGSDSASYRLHVHGAGYATSDFRAPIFIDSNDTGYYVDPNSSSRLYQTVTNVSYFGTDTNKGYAQGYGTYSSQLHKIARITFDWDGAYNSENHGVFSTDINGAYSDDMSINSFNDINLRIDSNDNDGASYVRFHMHTTGNNQFAYIGYDGGSYLAAFAGSTRSPIFYDSDDTGYYCDPNSTSRLWRLNFNLLDGSQTRYSTYNSSNTFLTTPAGLEYSGAFIHFTGAGSIAPSAMYRSSGDWPVPYGIGFGTGGESSGIFQQYHSGDSSLGPMIFYTGNDGSGSFSWRRHTWESTSYNGSGSNHIATTLMNLDWGQTLYVYGSARAPIFYDLDNTGYYIDPNNNANIAGSVYIGGWFRNYGYTGLYNESYGNHWYATGNDYWNLAGNNGTNVGIIFRTGGHQGASRGFVYADSSNNIGFLNSSGSWRLRVVDGDYILADGSSMRAQIFYDSNDTNYYLNPNDTGTSLRIAGYAYIGLGIDGDGVVINHDQIWTPNSSFHIQYSGSGNLQMMHGGGSVKIGPFGTPSHKLHVAGTIYSENDVRAPIFYDSTNTGFYIDPNSTTTSASLRGKIEFFDYDGATTTGARMYYGDRGTMGTANSAATIINYGADGFGLCLESGSSGDTGFMKLTDDGLIISGAADEYLLICYDEDVGSTRLYIDDSGNLVCSGNITAYSDIRLKTNIEVIPNAIDKIKQLRGVTFERIDEKERHQGARHTGLIAQEVEKVLPEVIETNKDGILSVAYGHMVGLLVEAIKEQQSEIDELKALVRQLLAK